MHLDVETIATGDVAAGVVDPSPELRALRSLHRIALLVRSADNLVEALQTAAHGVVDVLGFESVAVNLLTERGDFEAVTVVGPARGALLGTRNRREAFLSEIEAGDDWGLLRFVPAERQRASEGLVRWRTAEPVADHADAWRHDDALYAPLHDHRGDLMGILSLDLPADRRRPGPVRRQVLEIYVVQIGLTIGHARERLRMQEEVRLSRLVAAINSLPDDGEDLTALIATSHAALEVGLRADRAWIRLFADETSAAVNFPDGLPDDLHASAAGGAGFPPLDTDRVLAAGLRIAHECWAERRTVVVSRYANDTSHGLLGKGSRDRVLDWLEGLALSEFVLVPVGAASRCLGYVVLTRRESPSAWTDAESRAALEAGRELGRVIGNSRMRHRERELRRQLEDLDAHRSHVIDAVVHELKNPLAAIMGNLEMVQDDPTWSPRAHAAIGAASQRMLDLVEDMLTLSHLKRAAPAMREDAVDLSAAVHAAVNLLAGAAERSEIGLDLTGVEPGVHLEAAAEEIQRMASNLVSNAIKFSDPGGVVTVGLARVGGEVVLTCADTGLGIADTDVASLFQEFDRSSNPEARRRPGTGLGLAICHRIAARHDGRIEVTSALGEGSAFVVRLPAPQRR